MGEILFSIASFFDVILTYIYNIVPNFGITIIMLTLLVKLVTFPLNNQQIKSAKRMQEVQPELKKIQEKYKNDKEKQNQEVMKFMQENKVNPLAGCMPLLIQLPVLIGIFRLLRDVESFGISQLENFNPYLIPALADTGLQWGNLAVGDPTYIFPVLAGITTYLYSRLSMTDPNQKMMLYIMPAMIFVISAGLIGPALPAGLILYWIVNNMFSIGQHYLLTNKEVKEKEPKGKEAKEKEEKDVKGKEAKGAKAKSK